MGSGDRLAGALPPGTLPHLRGTAGEWRRRRPVRFGQLFSCRSRRWLRVAVHRQTPLCSANPNQPAGCDASAPARKGTTGAVLVSPNPQDISVPGDPRLAAAFCGPYAYELLEAAVQRLSRPVVGRSPLSFQCRSSEKARLFGSDVAMIVPLPHTAVRKGQFSPVFASERFQPGWIV